VKQKLLVAAIVVWFVGIAVAFAAVWGYKTTPGAPTAAPSSWPAASTIRPAAGVPNLVMFAHPQCPCTRASMAELARLASELGASTKIHVVLVRPDDTPAGFEHGAIAERARAIPDADVVVDAGGVEASRFGAMTSGATVLYAADGALLFAGGLTTARGHEGEGPSTHAILAAVRAPSAHLAEAPTFGCSITSPELAR
jgi:hypothetical protein